MQFTSPYAEERIVPFLNDRVVGPGETVPVPASVAGYFVQTWTPADSEADQLVAEYEDSLVADEEEPPAPTNHDSVTVTEVATVEKNEEG